MVTQILALSVSLRKWALVVIVSLFIVIIFFRLELIDNFKKLYDSGSFFDFFDICEVVIWNFPKDKEEWNLEKEFNSSYVKWEYFDAQFHTTMLMLTVSSQILNEKEPDKIINDTDQQQQRQKSELISIYIISITQE